MKLEAPRSFAVPVAAALLWTASTEPARSAATAFAATPQQAVQNIAGGIELRTNITGRYAVVATRGGSLEGEAPAYTVILAERFTFGWQPLADLYFSCRLTEHIADARVRDALMRGIRPGSNEAACGPPGSERDAGPRADVEAVRRLETGPLVPRVRVAGTYALGGWYGAGGGPHLFEKAGGRWRLEAGTGGAAGRAWLREHGVPRPLWCALLGTSPDCPAR